MSVVLKPLPVLLHTTAVAVMTYGYLNLPDMVANIPMANMKGGHFQFLTIQGYAAVLRLAASSSLKDSQTLCCLDYHGPEHRMRSHALG